MAALRSSQSTIVDFPPSCLSICQQQPAYFVIGTYLLHKPENGDTQHEGVQKRSGSLILGNLTSESMALISTQPIPESSILDLQWSPHETIHDSLLAVATSTGQISFWQLLTDGTTTHPKLIHTATHQICDPEILVLYLQWHPTRPNLLGVTLSDGGVRLCEASQNSWSSEATVNVHEITQHSLEAWCLAFEGQNVLSGGDDMVLQRTSFDETNPDEVVTTWRDRRIHGAGVTFILPLGEGLFLTGSYDDHIRLISAPVNGPWRVLAEENLGGGVWRLKVLGDTLHEKGSLLVLASCMHAGARIVKLTRPRDEEDSWKLEVVARFEEHQSMNYASDARKQDDGSWHVISTSFYDRRLCLWKTTAGT